MSRHDPSTPPKQEAERPHRQRDEPIELERGDRTQPLLRWLVVEDPEQSFQLHEDDYVLDSQFNPEFDVWEVLIRIEPDTNDE